jgi:hypothetical protein
MLRIKEIPLETACKTDELALLPIFGFILFNRNKETESVK